MKSGSAPSISSKKPGDLPDRPRGGGLSTSPLGIDPAVEASGRVYTFLCGHAAATIADVRDMPLEDAIIFTPYKKTDP